MRLPIVISKGVPDGALQFIPRDMLAKAVAGTLTTEELTRRAKECGVIVNLGKAKP